MLGNNMMAQPAQQSHLLRKVKLKRFIKQYANDNQREFSEKTGISPASISMMLGGTRVISDKMWEKVLLALDVEDKTIDEDMLNLKEFRLSKRTHLHHGTILKRYLEEKGIQSKQAAKMLDVSPAMVSIYKHTENFSPDVYEKIKLALKGIELPLAGTYVKLPLVNENIKNLSDLSDCPLYEIQDLKLIEGYNVQGAIVISVETDSLEPKIGKDSTLLAVKVPEKKQKYHIGLTAIQYADRLGLGEVNQNDIIEKGFVSLDKANGQSVKILAEDIQNMWHIVLGLKIKFS